MDFSNLQNKQKFLEPRGSLRGHPLKLKTFLGKNTKLNWQISETIFFCYFQDIYDKTYENEITMEKNNFSS